MHGVVYGHAPEYLVNMVVSASHLSGRSNLRSAQQGHLDIPRTRTVLACRSSSVAASQARNELPAGIHQTDTVFTFKRHLKLMLPMDFRISIL